MDKISPGQGRKRMALSMGTLPIIKGEQAKQLKSEMLNPTHAQRAKQQQAYMRVLKVRQAAACKRDR